MNLLIIIFTIASYFFGSKAIYTNKYRPNIYSRIIWLLLAINTLASVILLKDRFSVILLAALGFFGSFLILILSLKKSEKIFGPIEKISTVLLLISLGLWIFTRLPLLNLSIGFIIVIIGGLPSFAKVIKDPRDEDILFWLFFSLASAVSLISADKTNISDYIYPLFSFLFNLVFSLLCARRYIIKTSKN